MKIINTKRMVTISMIAALYTAICIALAPFSFGPIQVRVSEALTLLPIFSMAGVWGITLGCALSNLIGFLTGANILGIFDILFGTLATFLAALLTRKFRNMRILGFPFISAIPPIIINALVIGAELSFLLSSKNNFMATYMINCLYIAVGQFLSCFVLGIPLIRLLERTGTVKKYFDTIE